MFELGGEGAVAGDGSPAVVEHLARGLADVDHRLDGEEHAGAKLGAGAGLADMDDLRSVVEIPADAVAAEIADNAIAMALRVSLDGVRDVAQMVAGPRLLEAEHQRFVGDLDELLRLDGHVAAQIHTAGIAVPAVQERRHVDIEDVAVLQRAVAGDAVADDMVYRDARAVGIAAIAQGRGHGAGVAHHPVNDRVQLPGGDAGDDRSDEHTSELQSLMRLSYDEF